MHVPPFLQGWLSVHSFISWSQRFPWNPWWHLHVKPPRVFVHVPPFLHGELTHSSTSSSQRAPLNPCRHLQLNPPSELTQVPPFLHGFLEHSSTSEPITQKDKWIIFGEESTHRHGTNYYKTSSVGLFKLKSFFHKFKSKFNSKEEKKIIPCSHSLPSNPCWHAQVKLPGVFLQLPPFLHGELTHLSMSKRSNVFLTIAYKIWYWDYPTRNS